MASRKSISLTAIADDEHLAQISAALVPVFAAAFTREQDLQVRLKVSQAQLSRRRRHAPETRRRSVGKRSLDNIATESAPVWRPRGLTPLTPYAVRMQLIVQAEGATDAERQTYVRRRLTALDRALDDHEAQALEEWLYCEEVLAGRAKCQSWGDTPGGGFRQKTPVPDWMMAPLKSHAKLMAGMPAAHQRTLRYLGEMMRNPFWDFGSRPAQRRLIKAIREAARWLCDVSYLVIED